MWSCNFHSYLHLVIVIGRVRVEDPKHISNAASSQSPDLTTSVMVEKWLHQIFSCLVEHRAVVIIQTLTLTQILCRHLRTQMVYIHIRVFCSNLGRDGNLHTTTNYTPALVLLISVAFEHCAPCGHSWKVVRKYHRLMQSEPAPSTSERECASAICVSPWYFCTAFCECPLNMQCSNATEINSISCSLMTSTLTTKYDIWLSQRKFQ